MNKWLKYVLNFFNSIKNPFKISAEYSHFNSEQEGINNLIRVIYTRQRYRGHFKYFIQGHSKVLVTNWAPSYVFQ